MSEYVFRDAPGYGCDMSALMDGGRVTVGEYFASDNTDHYGTLHEEVVRCGKCRRAVEPPICKIWANHLDPDGFCAWSEKKEGGE